MYHTWSCASLNGSFADHDCDSLPTVREALLHQTYVDDICTGAYNEDKVFAMQAKLV